MSTKEVMGSAASARAAGNAIAKMSTNIPSSLNLSALQSQIYNKTTTEMEFEIGYRKYDCKLP